MKKNDNFDTKSKEFNNFERKKMIIIQKLKDKALKGYQEFQEISVILRLP